MVNILMFALKYRKYIAVAFAVLSLVGAFYAYDASRVAKGYANGIAECDRSKQETINDSIEIKKKIDGVVRDDAHADYINSLHNGEL